MKIFLSFLVFSFLFIFLSFLVFNTDLNLFESILLMAFCVSLEGQTITSLSAYATSAFSKHSLISTVLVVQNVVNGALQSVL